MTTDKDEPRRQAKVEINVGDLRFSGEGDEEWLGEQVAKLLKAAEQIGKTARVDAEEPSGPSPAARSSGSTPSLASYIRAKGADSNQILRFLATAAWLQKRGSENLTTSSVAKALTDNQQKRLANASDCLNKNVKKGLCEKTKDGFFITPEGWDSLGEEQ
ncbi:hypothetical protein [Methyloligella solikamskensis]|uniref:Uncharacterized protein n=1 Tax=Methyloligella solikamskensis TaxID=1177756 RepID=A0ABW3JBI4_9HYPH